MPQTSEPVHRVINWRTGRLKMKQRMSIFCWNKKLASGNQFLQKYILKYTLPLDKRHQLHALSPHLSLHISSQWGSSGHVMGLDISAGTKQKQKQQEYTVPLKGKLPVASRFRRDARYAIRVAQDSPKRKCLA